MTTLGLGTHYTETLWACQSECYQERPHIRVNKTTGLHLTWMDFTHTGQASPGVAGPRRPKRARKFQPFSGMKTAGAERDLNAARAVPPTGEFAKPAA